MNFEAFCSLNGVLIRQLRQDGRIHRCPTEAHPRKQNGAYKLAEDGSWGWCKAFDMGGLTQYWRADGRSFEALSQEERDRVKALAEQERKALDKVRAEACRLACDMLSRARPATHPYLARKGFPHHLGLVLDGELLVPMRDARNYRYTLSAQRIAADGTKLFIKGGQASYGSFRMGNGLDTIFCEGYATGLSVLEALKRLYRQATVVVCFSASNMVKVAEAMKPERGFVVADHDTSKERAGEVAAQATGYPYMLSPEPGEDYNDFHQRDAAAAIKALSALMTQETACTP